MLFVFIVKVMQKLNSIKITEEDFVHNRTFHEIFNFTY